MVTLSTTIAVDFSEAFYCFAFFTLLLLSGNFQSKDQPGYNNNNNSDKSSLGQAMHEGVKYLLGHKLLRTLLLMVGVMNFCWSSWISVLVLYVVTPGPVGLDSFGYSLLFTVMGVGGVVGAALVGKVQSKLGARWAIGADLFGTFMMGIVPMLTANPWLIGGAALLGGIGSAMWGVTVITIRQRLVPNYLLGRVSGATRLVGFGSIALGSIVSGVIAQYGGVQSVFALAAFLTALLIIPFMRQVTPAVLAQVQLQKVESHNYGC